MSLKLRLASLYDATLEPPSPCHSIALSAITRPLGLLRGAMCLASTYSRLRSEYRMVGTNTINTALHGDLVEK